MYVSVRRRSTETNCTYYEDRRLFCILVKFNADKPALEQLIAKVAASFKTSVSTVKEAYFRSVTDDCLSDCYGATTYI